MAADVWSATSWTELRRDALEADAALLRGEERDAVRHAGRCRAPRARCWRSPTTCARSRTRSRSGSSRTTPRWARTASASPTPVRRPAATSASTPQSIVVAALAQLARRGEVKASAVKEARERYGL